MKNLLPLLALAAACSHAPAKPSANGAAPDSSAIKVQDAVHGATYELAPGDEPWQVSREGSARTASGVEADVSSFPMGKQTTAAACRDHARTRLTSKTEPDSRTATPVDPPRDQTVGEGPTATWGFTTGSASAPVRKHWAFYARGADCLILEISSGKGDAFAERAFESAARSFKVLDLPRERQREIDLLAGMTFLERHDPVSALDRFEALSAREPDMAKAHFGAMMAGFQIGPPAYARVLPHGKAALKAERELVAEQREIALRAVGVMQLAEGQVADAASTLAELIVRAPALAEGQYNYACALARLGDGRAAIDHLKTAIELNGDLAANARDDEDLKGLRGLPEFQQLVSAPQAQQTGKPQ